MTTLQQRFAEHLTTCFEKVEPQFRAETIARYERHAESDHAAWVARINGDEPVKEGRWGDRCLLYPPQYTTWSHKGAYSPHTQATLRPRIATGEFTVDLPKARADANRTVDYAKQHFVLKQSKKLANACKQRDDVHYINGELSLSGVITGHLIVMCGDGDRFRLNMRMIVNYRYHGRRGFTSFHQFPARFADVMIGGDYQKGNISEAWMAENFKPLQPAQKS